MIEAENTVFVICNALSQDEIEVLRKECDSITQALSDDVISERSCSIDLFENKVIHNNDPIRKNNTAYFQSRFERTILSSKEQKDIQGILLSLFPTIICLLHNLHHLHLFNENYIVKPPNSTDIFSWHIDGDKQLSCCFQDDILYYSVWCPLEDVNSNNGTFRIPLDTKVTSYDLHTHNDSINLQEIKTNPVAIGLLQLSDSDACFTLQAGSMVIFSSQQLHCSGPNRSTRYRRVLYSQYSSGIITARGEHHHHVTEEPGEVEVVTRRGGVRVGHAHEDENENPLCYALPCDLAPCFSLWREREDIQKGRTYGVGEPQGLAGDLGKVDDFDESDDGHVNRNGSVPALHTNEGSRGRGGVLCEIVEGQCFCSCSWSGHEESGIGNGNGSNNANGESVALALVIEKKRTLDDIS